MTVNILRKAKAMKKEEAVTLPYDDPHSSLLFAEWRLLNEVESILSDQLLTEQQVGNMAQILSILNHGKA